jgi:hypothetical protein
MCFGRAIWLGRSLSRNALQCYCSAIAYQCGFAAYGKPPLVNILASDYPMHQTVLLQKRRNSCDTRAHCLLMRRVQPWCRSSCALIPVWCSRNCAKLCGRELRKLVRQYARVVRTEVVWLSDECLRLSFVRRGAMLCAHPPALVARRCQLLLRTRWSLPCRAHGMAKADWQGVTRLRVRLCVVGPAPPCVQCAAWMRVKCTRLSIPAATRMYTRCANF